MTHIRIYDNPKGKWLRAGQYPRLTVTGTLPDYSPGQAYIGRLQINNAQGDCSVVLVSETDLPNGYELTVDNETSEVVLRWPAYEGTVTESIPNPGLEDGNVGWDLGLGLEIGTWNWEYDGSDNDLQAYDGINSIEYHAGFRGNTRCRARSPRLCSAATSVTANCQVQQGPSAINNTGGWVVLQFLDAAGLVLSDNTGNHVDSSNDAAWHISTVTAVAPTGTTHAVIGAEFYRKKESKPMWIDTFTWNLAVDASDSVGTNGTGTISLCLQVTDSAGRHADWCGDILAFDNTALPLNLLAKLLDWYSFDTTLNSEVSARGWNQVYGGPISYETGIHGQQLVPTHGMKTLSVITDDTDWSQSFWLDLSLAGTTDVMIGIGSLGTPGINYYASTQFTTTNTVRLLLRDTGAPELGSAFIDIAAETDANGRVFVCLKWDESALTLTLAINAVDVVSLAGTVSPIGSGAEYCLIQLVSGAAFDAIDKHPDELVVYGNYYLTQADMDYLYNGGLGKSYQNVVDDST
jgi:hypothetical protein